MSVEDNQQGQRLIEASTLGDLSQVIPDSETEQAACSVTTASNQAHALQVESYLRSGADAAYQDTSDGSSPLIAAASQGHTEVVRTLLTAGAPWNAFDRQANCAGDYALAGEHKDCVDILLTAGKTVNT